MALLSLALLSLFTLTSYVPHGLTVPGPLSLALLSLFTLTSYVPLALLSLALLSLFTLTGPPTVPTVPIHPN